MELVELLVLEGEAETLEAAEEVLLVEFVAEATVVLGAEV